MRGDGGDESERFNFTCAIFKFGRQTNTHAIPTPTPRQMNAKCSIERRVSLAKNAITKTQPVLAADAASAATLHGGIVSKKSDNRACNYQPFTGENTHDRNTVGTWLPFVFS